MSFLEQLSRFFLACLPSGVDLLLWGPPGIVWTLLCLGLAGYLRQKGLRVGYTRKIFHFLVFGTVALLHWQLGISAVCLFGGACTVVVFFAVYLGSGNMLYQALAREKDAPHQTYFILLPYFTTLLGGLISSFFFGSASLAGYLVAGLGDAIGEPAGTLFGKHAYRVLSISSVPATRTLEGSAAVFLMSSISLFLTVAAYPQQTNSPMVFTIFLMAFICTLSEAFSPHGWDNASMQIIPSAMIWATMG